MNIITTLRQFRLVSIRIASYHFNPGVISTLITIAVLYIMLSLGFWQLERAEYKETLQQKITERKELPVMGLDELAKDRLLTIENRRYMPVVITGEFDQQHSFLLDNKTFKGRVGYHVFTPVKVTDSIMTGSNATSFNTTSSNITSSKTTDSKAVLVARGFVKMGKTREQLPDIATPSGRLDIRGIVDKQPSRALVLAENVNQINQWPAVLQYVDLTELSQTLGYELYDMVIWLNENETGAFEYDLPVLKLNSAKNSGYAFQWFAMSLALFIIYLVVNTKKNTAR